MTRSKYYTLLLTIIFLFFSSLNLKAQIVPSSATDVNQAISQRRELRHNSLIRTYPARSVGPVVMAGRVTDIAVNPSKQKQFYIAYASGGVFKTDDNGISFDPIFDEQGTLTIGDIAVSKANPQILWVGTGEVNSSRSSYAGSGVYKSTDGGKTWIHTGLTNTEHISRIITDPGNPDIAWVASEGALYSKSPYRGVYKTTDGGKTWNKTLFVNDSTGAIDLVMNPQNHNQLWAATWTRMRHAWNFEGSGSGSAIYVSNDGGDTWKKSVNGLPTGDKVGRIGLDICQSQPNILYAIVDNQKKVKEEKKKKESKKEGITFKSFKDMSVNDLLKLDNKNLEKFLRKNNFPKKYTAKSVKEDIKNSKYTPKDIADYNGKNALEAEVSSKVTGAQVYKSVDFGKHWKKVNSYELDGVYYTYGYYFAQIRVNPKNPNDLYIMGVPLLHSTDGGKTFTQEGNHTHSDIHAFWYDNQDPEHVMLGTDGGVYVSYDAGNHWRHLNSMAVGQFYSVDVDRAKPYNIYGGLQDNGVFYGSSQTVPDQSRHWKRLLGGDGMHVAVDRRDNGIVYAGFQFGNYFRINKDTGKHTYITPKHNIGEPSYRWNWNTPIVISPHNPDIIYMGSQNLLRSMDQGSHFQKISPDLTTDHQPQGNVPYSTITTISESPLKFGVIWVGTDDGNVQVTRDGGVHWQLVSKSLPQKRWISKVFASPFNEGTAYVSLNSYRYDQFKAMLYKTTDYGKTWKSISGDLPEENINVIIQDPVNPNLLFVGTDDGAYLSLNGGDHWQYIDTSHPNVPTYDMVIQPEAHDLVMGTHGRSVYVMHIKPLEELTMDKLDQPVIAYKPDNIRYSKHWGKATYKFQKPTEPSNTLLYYIGKGREGNHVKITITDKDGNTVQTLQASSLSGFHPYKWNLKVDKNASKKYKSDYLMPGKYNVTFEYGSSKDQTSFKVTSQTHSGNNEIPGDNE